MCNKCRQLPVDPRAASRVLAHAIMASSKHMTGKAIKPRASLLRRGKVLISYAILYVGVFGILAAGFAFAK